MTDTTIPSLKGLIEEEHRTARRNYPLFATVGEMTEEERKERDIRSSWQYRFKSAFHTVFREVLKSKPSPMCLLALPYKLANNNTFGTNVVMGVIVSDSVCAARLAHLEELFSDLWPPNICFAPSPEDAFGYFNRVQGRVDDLKDCTLAECFWLLEIAKWADCLLAISSREIEKALLIKGSVNAAVEESFGAKVSDSMPNFTRVLDRRDEKDKLILEAAFKQYDELEKLLRRF